MMRVGYAGDVGAPASGRLAAAPSRADAADRSAAPPVTFMKFLRFMDLLSPEL